MSMVSFKKADIIIFDLKMFPLVNFPWEKIKNILHTQEIIEKRCFLLIKSFPKVDPLINIEEASGLDKKLKTILSKLGWINSEDKNYILKEFTFRKESLFKENYIKNSSSIIFDLLFKIYLKKEMISFPFKYWEEKDLPSDNLDEKNNYFFNKISLEKIIEKGVTLNQVTIYTKEHGIFSSDTHLIPQSRLIKSLSYEEAIEVSEVTSKFIAPKTLKILKREKVSIKIKPFISSWDEKGTTIGHQKLSSEGVVKALGIKRGVTVVSLTNEDMWRRSGILAELFTLLKKNNLSVDLISTSETNITFSLDPDENNSINILKDKLNKEFGHLGEFKTLGGKTTISLIGSHIRSVIPSISPVFKVFENQKIYLMSQAASDINLSFIIDHENTTKCLKSLHEILFSNTQKNLWFGPTWQEIEVGQNPQPLLEKIPWWLPQKEKLLKIGKKQSPVYIYSEETLLKKSSELKSITSIDKVLFSMKANSHSEVLKSLHKNGIHFETVSIGEIKHLKKVIPTLKSSDILFTPNFISKDECKKAIREGVTFTLDNIYPLKSWASIFKNQKIFLRIDPGHGRGHHDYVKTAGEQSKFGILPTELDEIEKLMKKNKFIIKGLHAHAGSGIHNTEHWKEMGLFLSQLATRFKDIKVINVGGGLGVKNKPGDFNINLEDLQRGLSKVKDQFPQYEIWMEPGRYLTSEAGILLTKVTQKKKKGSTDYLGIDAGMNILIRPTLYGAYHHILNLTKLEKPLTEVTNIVGPICETGDKIGSSRLLPKSDEGDILLIENAGAYGKTMSSRYNLREEALEIFI